jgi:hypothetical protein
MTTRDTEAIRGAALDRMERTERHYKLAFFGAVVLEALFLAGYLVLLDRAGADERPVLVAILLATIAGYSIVVLGMVALGAHVNRATLRVLKAVEALGAGQRPETGS